MYHGGYLKKKQKNDNVTFVSMTTIMHMGFQHVKNLTKINKIKALPFIILQLTTKWT